MLLRHCDACGKEVDSGYYRLDVSNNSTNDKHPRRITLDLCPGCYNTALNVLSYCGHGSGLDYIDRLAGHPTWKPKPGLDVKIFTDEKLGIPNL